MLKLLLHLSVSSFCMLVKNQNNSAMLMCELTFLLKSTALIENQLDDFIEQNNGH